MGDRFFFLAVFQRGIQVVDFTAVRCGIVSLSFLFVPTFFTVVLDFVVYASPTSTSSGALRRLLSLCTSGYIW